KVTFTDADSLLLPAGTYQGKLDLAPLAGKSSGTFGVKTNGALLVKAFAIYKDSDLKADPDVPQAATPVIPEGATNIMPVKPEEYVEGNVPTVKEGALVFGGTPWNSVVYKEIQIKKNDYLYYDITVKNEGNVFFKLNDGSEMKLADLLAEQKELVKTAEQHIGAGTYNDKVDLSAYAGKTISYYTIASFGGESTYRLMAIGNIPPKEPDPKPEETPDETPLEVPENATALLPIDGSGFSDEGAIPVRVGNAIVFNGNPWYAICYNGKKIEAKDRLYYDITVKGKANCFIVLTVNEKRTEINFAKLLKEQNGITVLEEEANDYKLPAGTYKGSVSLADYAGMPIEFYKVANWDGNLEMRTLSIGYPVDKGSEEAEAPAALPDHTIRVSLIPKDISGWSEGKETVTIVENSDGSTGIKAVNGLNGYCLHYGDFEVKKGDKFFFDFTIESGSAKLDVHGQKELCKLISKVTGVELDAEGYLPAGIYRGYADADGLISYFDGIDTATFDIVSLYFTGKGVTLREFGLGKLESDPKMGETTVFLIVGLIAVASIAVLVLSKSNKKQTNQCKAENK
ncbi:MAG: hypothetical protein RR177_00950, partial [Oscillospiraceae bacterium]